MSHLRHSQGGEEQPPARHRSIRNLHSADDISIGPPRSLLVGIVTGLLGAGAGVMSLLLFFQVWQPGSYISQQWLPFVFVGAVIGFFLRLEQPLEAAFSRVKNGDDYRR